MTTEQVHLVRKSFAEVARLQHVAALIFYKRLFEVEPRLRPLFKNDIEEQSRKLTDMLAALISMLERSDTLVRELQAMGARHAGYGVQESHYATVGGALLDMLAEVLGDGYRPEVKDAWVALYTVVADTMIAGAREAAGKTAPALAA